MERNIKLTEGNISKALIRLALPIMATSFVQMAYNLTDMMWLGRVGTNAVAASGTAGFFTWLGSALFTIPKIGAEVGVAQSYGKEDLDRAKKFTSNTLKLDMLIALIYSLILIIFRHQIIGFFRLGDSEVIKMATDYLLIVSFGLIFYFLNPVFSGVFNGSGDSSTPFKINTVGLIINIILDPLMIMGIGPFPEMGIKGAALATIIAQFTVTILFVIISKKKSQLFQGLNLLRIPFDKDCIKTIFKLGLPVAIQQGLFASIAMVIARIIAQWGPTPVAVQKVGSQIESISWMTAGGFSTAISAFVGQNYGAEKWYRIKKGYRKGLLIVGSIGIFATLLLGFGAAPLFKLFIPKDPEALQIGIRYLRILAVSQFFMSIEIASQGAFNGLGKTIPPSLVGITFNALRIPASLILSTTFLGLDGVWWSISISSVFKGIILTIWYIIILEKLFPSADKRSCI
ncbi:MATE family efflux transporter [Clostridium sp. Cult1]|jgi:putative MATE family efflux protein|uniref:MATE family efflux transporter n=1 Tax=Clostridium sp. Cult1 TaxID=2079002 RepID=UPI001F191617|nr:MATE family efflux transporter [Clostridium sp. Cult1]MCF6463591.1 MATE family efflux transporter [Clostridium sp. Cult1]